MTAQCAGSGRMRYRSKGVIPLDQHCQHNDERIDQLLQDSASNTTEHASFRRRLDELEQSGKRQNDILLMLQRQADAIESMGKRIDSMTGSLSSAVKRLEVIEREPGDRYRKLSYEIVKYIVLAVVGVVVGYFIKG